MDECSIVYDLLPLYIDELTSTQNSKMIEEHLKTCTNCQNEYNRLKKNLQISTSVKKIKNDKKIINKLRFEYYIPCYIFIILAIFSTLAVQLYIVELFFITIIALIGCGFISQILIKNVYSTSIITIICSFIVANSFIRSTGYNILGIYINICPIKVLLIFILEILFYILFGYFISYMITNRKFKIILFILYTILVLITSIPTSNYKNLWDYAWTYEDFKEEVKFIQDWLSPKDTLKLTSFKYSPSTYSYFGEFSDQNNNKYRISSYSATGIKESITSEVEYKRATHNYDFEGANIIKNLLIANGLKFYNQNDVRIEIENPNGVYIINQSTPEYEIEAINKYSILMPHNDNTDITLYLNLREYLNEIKTPKDFVIQIKKLISTLNTLPLYYDTLQIKASSMEVGKSFYQIELKSKDLNLSAEEIEKLIIVGED